jgi:2,4-dienoyl-CoA reductase-like NADH-dependent reductase (Old Yellow Enzyme family)
MSLMSEGASRGTPSAAKSVQSALFRPGFIGKLEIKNRWVFQPHFTALGTWDGMPSDGHTAYHEARARGGAGLIIFESQAVHPTGKASRRMVNAWDPRVIPALRRVTDAVHTHGAKIFSQLNPGHSSVEHPPPILWAPTQMPEPSSNFSTKAMDLDDIRAVVAGFAASARNAVDAGFDGIEVKIGHDGLLRSFASPFFNRRADAAEAMRKISYAGYRFPPEVIHQAVWLYLRFTLSFRDVEDLLAERGIGVS